MTINNLRSSKMDSSRENQILSILGQGRDSAHGPASSKGLCPNKKFFGCGGRRTKLKKRLMNRKKTKKQPSDVDKNFLKQKRAVQMLKKSVARVKSLQEEAAPEPEESYFEDVNRRESGFSRYTSVKTYYEFESMERATDENTLRPEGQAPPPTGSMI